MLQNDRYDFILNLLKQNKSIQVKEIASLLNISESTIRRDLINLEKEGKLNRVHGGAILGEGMTIYNQSKEIKISDRTLVNIDIKLKIAQEVSKNIQDGQCIFIDGGSSLAPLADLLAHRDINIVTNSILFLQRLENSFANVYCLVGDYLYKYQMTMGPIATAQLSTFNFDAAYISCAGVSFENNMGYTAEIGTNVIKQQAKRQALHSYLIIDDSKIEMIGFCTIDKLDAFDKIYCNKIDDIENAPENMVWV